MRVHKSHSITTSRSISATGKFIQPKLKIGKPNDRYEQEADRMADHIIHKKPNNAPNIQRMEGIEEEELQLKCAECEQEEELQRMPEDDEDELQMKSKGNAPNGSIENRLSASKGNGRPLENDIRSEMEAGFGSDFGNVRIHEGNNAVQMSQSLNAQAFTNGNDIYFNKGKYNTASNQGKHLLAHELTHTIQQKGNPQIQRRMGFEFQTPRKIAFHRTGKKLKRTLTKMKPIKPKKVSISSKLKMEVDVASGNSSVIEFVTGAYKKWDPLNDEIKDAVKIIDHIKKLPIVKKKGSNAEYYSNFETSSHGSLDISKGRFTAKPQNTEGVRITEFPSLLGEHIPEKYSGGTIKSANSISQSNDLKGFLTLIIFYLNQLQWGVIGKKIIKKPKVPKNFIAMMSRVDFSDIYESLNAADRKAFRILVQANGKKANAIEKEAGLKPNSPVFKYGYWVITNKYVKRKGKKTDKITHMLLTVVKGKTTVKGLWSKQRGYVDCSKEAKGSPYHKACKKPLSKAFKPVTVRKWLESMYKGSYKKKVKKKFQDKKARRQAVDLLSPLPGWAGSQGAGYGMGQWAIPNKKEKLIPIEMRGHKGSLHYKDWKCFALHQFLNAAFAKRGDISLWPDFKVNHIDECRAYEKKKTKGKKK